MAEFTDIASLYQGCISERTCPTCGIKIVCDSVRAGTREGNIRYIHGPCCCGHSICAECGHDEFPKISMNNYAFVDLSAVPRRYVILIPEDYDCYTVDVPYPVYTTLSKNEILGEMEDWFKSLRPGKYNERTYAFSNIDKRYRVPGSNALVGPHQIEECVDGHYDFKPPAILTVDEWFGECPKETEVRA